jgi:hypothetical protein
MEGSPAALPASKDGHRHESRRSQETMRSTMVLILGAAAAAALLVGILIMGGSEAKAASCARGTKPAIVAGNFKCLRAGLKCSASYQAQYRKYGFHCAKGRLRKGTGVAPASSAEPPYTPPPAPTPAAVDGHYKGVTSQNETFEFDITNSGWTFKGLKTGQINQGCTPQFHLYGGNFDWANSEFSLTAAGDFTIDTNLIYGGTDWGNNWSGHLTVHGHMNGQAGSGSIEVKNAFTYNGTAYTCGSGLQTWTVTKVS